MERTIVRSLRNGKTGSIARASGCPPGRRGVLSSLERSRPISLLLSRPTGYVDPTTASQRGCPEGEVRAPAVGVDDSVQRAGRATSRARRPRISPWFLAYSGDVLDQRRALARAQGPLSRAERRFPTWLRRRWSGSEAAGLLPNAAAKFGVGASSVSRALEPSKTTRPPLRRNGGRCRLRVLMDECG